MTQVAQSKPLVVAADANAAPLGAAKQIIAERFKSKMCRNYMKTGVCPYEHRCMFAHGQHEVRTKAENIADGVTTEEAVKAFQRKVRSAALVEKMPSPPAYSSYGPSSSSMGVMEEDNSADYGSYGYNGEVADYDGPCQCDDCLRAAQMPCQCAECAAAAAAAVCMCSECVSTRNEQQSSGYTSDDEGMSMP
jgi:hypothetical protein